jgi:hypothetical protein
MLDFKQLKLTYDHIAAAIGKGQEPTEELVTAKRYLQDLCANHGELLKRGSASEGPDESGLPAEQIRYILEDFSPGLIRQMCRERSRDDQVSTLPPIADPCFSTSRCAAPYSRASST